MNAHVNLGAWWHAQSAGKTGAESVPDTPHEDAAEEGVITAEFAVALPAVTGCARPRLHGRRTQHCATALPRRCAPPQRAPRGRTCRRKALRGARGAPRAVFATRLYLPGYCAHPHFAATHADWLKNQAHKRC